MERSFEVKDAHAGARLDVFLVAALDEAGVGGWSRSRVQRAIKDGRASVDGKGVRRTGVHVEAGQAVRLGLDDGREVSVDTSGRRILELEVLHEDEAIAVIAKPAGLVSHPSPRQLAGTVSDLAVERFGPLPEVQGEDRPGIVHRLDRLTSGVMVLGRTEAALEHLKAQFKARTVQKRYVALVHGTPRFEEEWIDLGIEPDPKRPDRMRAVRLGPEPDNPEWWTPPPEAQAELDERRAKRAETLVQKVEVLGAATLVHASPKTGRTHQIRVHLHAAGLPIVGDRVYGPRGRVVEPLPKGAPSLERPALHAESIEFEHPVTGEQVCFESPLASDFAELLTFLREWRRITALGTRYSKVI
ncbi:MAG: RluA family pseudouridine synthase, partial [Planctomycetota bacterium]